MHMLNEFLINIPIYKCLNTLLPFHVITMVYAKRSDWGEFNWNKLNKLFVSFSISLRAFLVAQLVKNLPAKWGDLGSITGLGRSLGEGNATHASILAWRIPWTVYSPWGHKELDMTEQLSLSIALSWGRISC